MERYRIVSDGIEFRIEQFVIYRKWWKTRSEWLPLATHMYERYRWKPLFDGVMHNPCSNWQMMVFTRAQSAQDELDLIQRRHEWRPLEAAEAKGET